MLCGQHFHDYILMEFLSFGGWQFYHFEAYKELGLGLLIIACYSLRATVSRIDKNNSIFFANKAIFTG